MSNIPERLIDDESRKHLQERFQNEMKGEVTVDLFVGSDNADYVEFTEKVLTELSEIDSRIKVNKFDISSDEAKARDLKTSPSLTIGWDKGYKVEYWGAPAGYETGGLIETLLFVSNDNSGLPQSTLETLDYLDKEVKLYSFVTPTCPYCPQSAVLNHKLAIAKKGLVRSICVEANENMELSQKFAVSSVPQQNINDDTKSTTVGVQPESSYIDQVLSYGSTKYEELKKVKLEKEMKAAELVDNPDYPVKLTDATFNAAITKYPFVVVDCWAEWCSPCKMIAPIVDDLAKEKQGEIVFGKLDTDHNPAISNQFGIRSIPTLLVFKNGEKVGQIVGAKPKAALLKEIEAFK